MLEISYSQCVSMSQDEGLIRGCTAVWKQVAHNLHALGSLYVY
jgi:hypothetical protein